MQAIKPCVLCILEKPVPGEIATFSPLSLERWIIETAEDTPVTGAMLTQGREFQVYIFNLGSPRAMGIYWHRTDKLTCRTDCASCSSCGGASVELNYGRDISAVCMKWDSLRCRNIGRYGKTVSLISRFKPPIVRSK